MNIKHLVLTALMAGFTLLAACGGGGAGVAGTIGQPGGGIGGSGVTVSGTITGTGSIFVNGIRFNTDSAQITIDGEPATEDDLRIGMVVTVRGTINDDGVTGTAEEVNHTNAIQGPADVPLGDGDVIELLILGQRVIVERNATVFEGVSFDELLCDCLFEVSGFVNDAGALRATRLARLGDFVQGESVVELPGEVANLDGTQFTLGDFTIDFAGADLSGLPGGTVNAGETVLARGTLTDQLLTADRVTELRTALQDLRDDEEASVEGAVTGLVDINQFVVAGVPVNATNAVFDIGDRTLRNGQIVQVDGDFRGDTLIATDVVARRGLVNVEATVIEFGTNNESLTLQLQGGTVTVRIDNATTVTDSTRDTARPSLSNFAVGDFLAVEALDSDRGLIATVVNRIPPGDDRLQGAVESFTPNRIVTVLGITYLTEGASFRGANGSGSTAEEFYEQLQQGDIIRIQDDDLADGVADSVVFGF